ncbi:MAG: hypothetical protein K2X66_09095 [Cyanobacteria bacterium]|nr:hypothetical protein [Cyanobacteriota bacterium]
MKAPSIPLGGRGLNLTGAGISNTCPSKTHPVSLKRPGRGAPFTPKATASTITTTALREGFYPISFGHNKNPLANNNLVFPAPHLFPQDVLNTSLQFFDRKISLLQILKAIKDIDNGIKVNGSHINSSLSLGLAGKSLDFIGETLEFLGSLGFLEVEKQYHVIWLKDWRLTKEGRKRVSIGPKESAPLPTQPMNDSSQQSSASSSTSWLQLTTDPSVVSETAYEIDALKINVYNQILIAQTHEKLLDFQTLETPLSEDVTNLTLLKTLQSLQQNRYRWSRWILPGISEGNIRSKFRSLSPEALHQGMLTLQNRGFLSQTNASQAKGSSIPHPKWALTPKSSSLLESLPLTKALALKPVGVFVLLKKALIQLQTKQTHLETLFAKAEANYQKAVLAAEEAQRLWEIRCQEAVSLYDQEISQNAPVKLNHPTSSLQEKLFKANHQELILEAALQEKNKSAAECQRALADSHRFVLTAQQNTLQIQKALLQLKNLFSQLNDNIKPLPEITLPLTPQEEESFRGILKTLLSLNSPDLSTAKPPVLPLVTDPPEDPALALQKEIQRLRLLQKKGSV